MTLNPAAHIDPVGLLMVVIVGFGFAKPVPTNPVNFTSPRADLWVAAAGPMMNLLLARRRYWLMSRIVAFAVQICTHGTGMMNGEFHRWCLAMKRLVRCAAVN